MKSLLIITLLHLLTYGLYGQEVTHSICTDNTIEGINTSINFYKKKLDKNAENQEALYALGMSNYKLNLHQIAIEYFDKLIFLDSKNKAVFLNRGMCKYMLKDLSGACQDFEESVKRGVNPKALNNEKISTFIKRECKKNKT